MSLIAFFLSAVAMTAAGETPAYAPPEIKEAPLCVCPASVERPDVHFSGYVIDAEVTLSGDMRSVEDRMATVFDVKWSSDSDVKGRTRLWHTTSPASCGLSFDYGKKYSVAARRSEDGGLETDKCLMRAAD